MSEKAHNLEQPFQASTSVETHEDIALIKEALNRLHTGCDKHSKELIESRNLSTRLKNECAELQAECDSLSQELKNQEHKAQELKNRFSNQLQELKGQRDSKEKQVTEIGQQLSKKEDIIEKQTVAHNELMQKLDEQSKKSAHQVKECHDLNLLLLEKENRYRALEKRTEKDIEKFRKDSRILAELRNMLGGSHSPAEQTTDSLHKKTHVGEKPTEDQEKITSVVGPQASQTMEESFEQWLNPPNNKDFQQIEA
jgi:chromosome segregation ATPase